ncbi:MAG: hypothetical protein ACE5PM_09035 [Candidatus Hydrothermarchaeales archaeon]
MGIMIYLLYGLLILCLFINVWLLIKIQKLHSDIQKMRRGIRLSKEELDQMEDWVEMIKKML